MPSSLWAPSSRHNADSLFKDKALVLILEKPWRTLGWWSQHPSMVVISFLWLHTLKRDRWVQIPSIFNFFITSCFKNNYTMFPFFHTLAKCGILSKYTDSNRCEHTETIWASANMEMDKENVIKYTMKYYSVFLFLKRRRREGVLNRIPLVRLRQKDHEFKA